MKSAILFIIAITLVTPLFAGPLQINEFIYEQNPPTPSCHASTIAEAPGGLVAAWFGGTAEGNKDVCIWSSRFRDGKWSVPAKVAEGTQADGTREPCWNPVLFQQPAGTLILFYKVGPSPKKWWGMMTTSADDGTTWSIPKRLRDGILGPIKNKPILLADGMLLCPTSTEADGWRAYFEATKDFGQTWAKSDLINDGKTFSLIQPTLLDHGTAGLQALLRSKQGKIIEVRSLDEGKTWSPPAASTLLNPNSGIDAVRLGSGRSLLVYNPVAKGRSPVSIAMSDDDGRSWIDALELERGPGEYSYPAVIQTTDGLVHITYTWRRQRIRHVVIDPRELAIAKDALDARGK